ncbi:MAG TPA: oligosaccharide flippase family protein [Ignavibacteriaceae bacterium]|nr:oligosaccharide flippase family protein [Ignavibacteriaceae bacterium]
MYLDQAEDVKKTAGNLSSSFLIRIARYPFLAVYIIVIPRMLGSSNYGELAFFISIVMLTSDIFTFGLPLVLGRFIPEFIVKKEQTKLEQLVSGYFILEFIISLILGLTGIVLYFALPLQEEGILPYIIIYFAIIIEIYSAILFSTLYGLNYVGKANMINLFRTAFRLLFIFALYPVFGFLGAIFSLLLTPLVSGIYAFFSIGKVIKIKIHKPIIKEFIPKLKFGVVIFTPTLLFSFQQQIGPAFLKSFSYTNSEIGFFDLANQGFLVLYGLAIVGFDALIPITSKFQVIGRSEKSIDWLTLLLRYILPIILIIVSGFYFFGKELITFVLGMGYIHIYPIALIILSTIPIWVIGQLGYVRSVSLSKAKPYFLSALFSTVIFVLFGILSIKNLGSVGLALAILFSSITFSISMLLFYKELISRLTNILLKMLISLISFLPIFLLNSPNIALKILTFSFCLGLFLVILSKLEIINKNEIKQIIAVLERKNPNDEVFLYS